MRFEAEQVRGVGWEFGRSGASGNTGRNLKERARLGACLCCSVHNRSSRVRVMCCEPAV